MVSDPSSLLGVVEAPAVRVTEAPRRRYYRPELDVLRFCSFFAVFVAHLPWIYASAASPRWKVVAAPLYMKMKGLGSFGLCMFFLLSSYLITELLIRERDKTGTIHLRAFYIRRACRIWPLYFFILAVGWTLGHIFQAQLWISWHRVVAYLFMWGNWYQMFNGWGPFTIGHLWSISVEEQFYLVWPALALFGGRKALTAGSFAFILVFFAVCTWLYGQGDSTFSQPLWNNTFIHFLYFATGALISILLNGKIPVFATRTRVFGLLLPGLLLWVSASLWMPLHLIPVPAYLAVALSCTLIFLSALGATRLPAALVYLGKISYGLYVYHGLALVSAETLLKGVPFHTLWVFILALAMTIGVSMLSYKFLEAPFLKLKERFTFVPSRRI